jgi:hypothetical protein
MPIPKNEFEQALKEVKEGKTRPLEELIKELHLEKDVPV